MNHLNPMIGFGEYFVSEHRVIFAVDYDNPLKGQLTKYGFEEVLIDIDPLLDHDKDNNLSKETKFVDFFVEWKTQIIDEIAKKNCSTY